MSTEAALWLAVGMVGVLAAAGAKPTRKAVVGLLGKDKQGRTTLVVWPASKGKRKGQRR